MKTIEKDDLFQNVRLFLGTKGIQLGEGSYTQTIQKSCRILADVINLGQQGIERAKGGIDKKLDQVRQAIHEKTAPKPPKTEPRGNPATEPTPEPAEAAGAEEATQTASKAKARPKRKTATTTAKAKAARKRKE
jgi:hypothetical protein